MLKRSINGTYVKKLIDRVEIERGAHDKVKTESLCITLCYDCVFLFPIIKLDPLLLVCA